MSYEGLKPNGIGEGPFTRWPNVPWKIMDVAMATATIILLSVVLFAVLWVSLKLLGTTDPTSITPWVFGIFEGLMVYAVWRFGIRKYSVSWRVTGLRPARGRGTIWLPWLALAGSLIFLYCIH